MMLIERGHTHLNLMRASHSAALSSCLKQSQNLPGMAATSYSVGQYTLTTRCSGQVRSMWLYRPHAMPWALRIWPHAGCN